MDKVDTKVIDEKIKELHDSLIKKPLQVGAIFNDFFGEDKVDLQYSEEKSFTELIKRIKLSVLIYKEELRIPDSKWEEEKCDTVLIRDISDSTIIDGLFSFLHTQIGTQRLRRVTNLNFTILIHFPKVRVTNEHNRFIDITQLWAKVKVSTVGTLLGTFTLNRSEYNKAQFSSNYMHSHISDIPKDNLSQFQIPCLGEGPILETTRSLNLCYDEDVWNLFCLELSKYVTVESVLGVPYHYLERLGAANTTTEISKFRFIYKFPINQFAGVLGAESIKNFIKYFISTKKLKFNYNNGNYSIGMSIVEYMVLISNEFISWYNNYFIITNNKVALSQLINNELLIKCIIDNNRLYRVVSSDEETYLPYIGKHICYFKGENITLNITDYMPSNENNSLILNPELALYILNKILKVLNYRYGRQTECIEEEYLPNSEVRYL